MEFAEAAYLGALLVSSLAAVGVGVWVNQMGSNRPTRLFVALVAIHPLIGLSVAVHLLASPGPIAELFFSLHTITGAAAPVLWFLFAVAYTGRDHWLNTWTLGGISAWYLALAGILLTNPIHHLAWTDPTYATEPFSYMVSSGEPLFAALMFPVPIFYLTGLGLLAHRFVFGSGVSRVQSILLIVAFLPPLALFSAWIAGFLPGPLDGAFVIGSAWSLGIVAWAVFRYRLFDVVPLGRQTVFEELDETLLVVDHERRLLDANTAAYDAFPRLQDGLGRPVDDLIPELVDGDAFVEGFVDVRSEPPVEYAVTVSVIRRDVDDQPRGFGVILRDVTERQQRVRTLERQTTQLERFASTLSHDIRNPLNVASGRVELAIETEDVEHLPPARSALDRIEQIISDLLTLTREGRTIDENALQRVQLAEVVRSAWAMTDTKDATLDVAPDAGGVVYADPGRLQSAFENLFRNSVEHGGSDVTVTVGRHPNGFYVEDDGAGVTAETLEHAFEYQYTTSPSGTGLGLAIVESIVEAHGWTITMEAGRAGGVRITVHDVDFVEPAASGGVASSD